MVIAPEHELVSNITSPERKKKLKNISPVTKNRSEIERIAEVKISPAYLPELMELIPLTGKKFQFGLLIMYSPVTEQVQLWLFPHTTVAIMLLQNILIFQLFRLFRGAIFLKNLMMPRAAK